MRERARRVGRKVRMRKPSGSFDCGLGNFILPPTGGGQDGEERGERDGEKGSSSSSTRKKPDPLREPDCDKNHSHRAKACQMVGPGARYLAAALSRPVRCGSGVARTAGIGDRAGLGSLRARGRV